jgi:hypothetical protein
MNTTTISKPRKCLECGEVFDAATATKPAGMCSERCKKARHAARVREYRARKRREFERLQAIVSSIENVTAA